MRDLIMPTKFSNRAVLTPIEVKELRDLLDEHLTVKEQVFTVMIVVPDYVVHGSGEMNVHQAKNHLRKYVAEKLNAPSTSIGAFVNEGSA